MNALESAVKQEAERRHHLRRWAYLRECGWELTPEGLILDTSDSVKHTQSREIVEYVEALPFETGVSSAWRRQKYIEAEELVAKQRGAGGRR
jgi:hypothetical protein